MTLATGGSTAALQAGQRIVFEMLAGERSTLTIQPDRRYKVVRKAAAPATPDTATPDDAPLPDDLIPAHHGAALLLLRYADGSEVEVSDFYSLCSAANHCHLPLAGDSAAGVELEAMAQGQPELAGFVALDAQGKDSLGFAASAGGAAIRTPPTITPLLGTVQGVILAGPVVAGNDLQVSVLAADGMNVLAYNVAVDCSGHFSARIGSYSGVEFVEVSSQGSGFTQGDVLVSGGTLGPVNSGNTGLVSGTVVGCAGRYLLAYNNNATAAQIFVEQTIVTAAHVLRHSTSQRQHP